MARRAHHKSRGGCSECKRRHIKCDEQRPICSNCVSSERLCGYAGFRIIRHQPTEPSSERTHSPEPIPDTSLIQSDSPANMLYIELFHHLSTHTLPSLYESAGNLFVRPTELINIGLTTPYLLNELLALASLHLGILRKSQQETYIYHSARLQNHALRLLKESESELNHEAGTSIPVLLFSSVLGVHLLCDTLLLRNHDFQDFLDRFIHYLRIHRGVRTVIGGNWAHLKQSSLSSVFEGCEASVTNNTGSDPVFADLLALIKGARLGEAFTETYAQAIDSLQQAVGAGRNGSSGRIHGALFWPVVVPSEYIDMLVQRRPEALVLLAHFAVLLHSCRDMWVFGNGGRFIIECISQYLGSEWLEWMEWPIRCLADSVDNDT